MPSFSLPVTVFLVSCIGLLINLVLSEPLSSEVENGIASEAHDTLRASDQQLQDAANALFSGGQMGSQVGPGGSGSAGNPLDSRRFWPNGSGSYPGLPPSANSNAVYAASPQSYYYNNSAYEYQGLAPGDKHQYLDPYLYSQPNAKYAKPPQPVGYDQNGNVLVAQAYKVQSAPVSYQASPVGGAGGVMSPPNPYLFGNASRSFSGEHGFYAGDVQDPRLGKEAGVRRLLRSAVSNSPGKPVSVSRARREMPTDFGRKEHAPGRRDLLKQILGSVGEDFKVHKVGPISLGGKILKREAELTVIEKKKPGKAKRASHRETGSEQRNRNSDEFGGGESSLETGSLDTASSSKTMIRREAKSGSGDFRPNTLESDSKTGSKDERSGAKLKNRREAVFKTGSTGRLPDDSRSKQFHRRAASAPPERKASEILREKIMHWKEANFRISPGGEGTDGSRVKLLQRRAASFKTGSGDTASQNSKEKSKHQQGTMATSSDRKFQRDEGMTGEERGLVPVEMNRLRRHSNEKSKCLCTSKVPVNAIVPCDRSKTTPMPKTPPPKHAAGAMCTTKCVLNILVPCPGKSKNGLSEVPENAIVAEENDRETGSPEDPFRQDEASRAEDLPSPDSAEKNSNESGRAETAEKQTSSLAGAPENEKAQRETEKGTKEQG